MSAPQTNPFGETSAVKSPESAIDLLHSPVLQGAQHLTHAFSTRTGGVSTIYGPSTGRSDLNLGYTPQDDAENVRENRRRFLAALHADAIKRFALLQQQHSAIVHVIDDSTALADDFTAPGMLQGDGVMTNRPGTLLAIGTADCMPVLLFDPVRRVVAAFHAGWRGTVARIVEQGVGTLQQQFGSNPEDLLAAIGPGIGPASYAVSAELRRVFEAQFHYAEKLFTQVQVQSTPSKQLYLDLPQANRQQLLDAGLRAEHIDVLEHDTAADTERFFSHRAEHGFTGRMLSVIGLTA